MRTRSLVWFRQDLRLHDNEAILESRSFSNEQMYVYIFDERVFFGKSSFGFPKSDKFRTQFTIESVHDLRKALEEKGASLIVRVGKPEEILFELCQETKSSWVFCNRERTEEEVRVQDALERNLWSIGREVRFSRGKMLYHTGDLPFPITQTPDSFAMFRKEVEKSVPIRKPLQSNISEFGANTYEIEKGEIPDLTFFGYSKSQSNFTPIFFGGESSALKELKYYLWDTDLIRTYHQSRKELLGRDFSSKLSAYLSLGCISPKQIVHEIFSYESERKRNKSTYRLIVELIWRDFYRLMGKKYGNLIFKVTGIQGNSNVNQYIDLKVFNMWANGETGVPFIDANMRELNSTGYISNRGRLNVASYLVNDLNINWLIGAEYFESKLIDYDPCSNYGNWNDIARVGIDPRNEKPVNVTAQALQYDPRGEYVDYWMPES